MRKQTSFARCATGGPMLWSQSGGGLHHFRLIQLTARPACNLQLHCGVRWNWSHGPFHARGDAGQHVSGAGALPVQILPPILPMRNLLASSLSSLPPLQEYIAGGTLKRMVFNKQLACGRGVMYRTQDALRWSMQVAQALRYLHEANPRVIHRCGAYVPVHMAYRTCQPT